MISLYEITQKQIEIYNELLETEGEMSEELEQAFDINKDNLKEKLENYVIFIDSMDAELELIKKEEERLKAKAKQITAKKENLLKNLASAMVIFGEESKLKSVKSELTVFNTRKIQLKESTSMVVLDPDKVPSKFTSLEMKTIVDKKALRKAIDDGEIEPTSDFYIDRENKLTIK